MPDVQLPKHLEGYPEDAEEQIRRAVEFHERVFGQQAARHVALRRLGGAGRSCRRIAAAGIEWIATDEEILSLLDRRLGLARWPRVFAQSRDALSPLARGGEGAAACRSCFATTR